MQTLKQWSVWCLLAIGLVGMACNSGGIGVEATSECAEKADGEACNDGAGVCQNSICQLNVSVETCEGAADGSLCDNGNGTCQDGTCQPNTPQPSECESATNGTPCATGICHDSACKAPADVPCGTGAGTLCVVAGETCQEGTCQPETSQPDECESADDDGTPCDNGSGICHDSACKAPADVPCGTGAGSLCVVAGETCQGGTCQPETSQPGECETADDDGTPCDNGSGICHDSACKAPADVPCGTGAGTLCTVAGETCQGGTCRTVPPPYMWTVTFESNGADTPADPETLTVAAPATIVGTLPTPPELDGCIFDGWNTGGPGGGGIHFTESTEVDADLIVYAQWACLVQGELEFSIEQPTTPLSPLNTSLSFSVVVSSFISMANANRATLQLDIDSMDTGLFAEVESATVRRDGITYSKTFSVRVDYDGTSEWASGSAIIQLAVGNFAHTPPWPPPSATLSIRDGREKTQARVIWVSTDNILDFNTYANTDAGLAAHYVLTENVVLTEPPEDESNWTAIGTDGAAFTGSFDGGGHTLDGLVINSTESYQAMFGYIGSGAEVENLGLLDVSVSGAGYVGGLVGHNSSSTVQGCYATGEVSGTGDYVGGLVGYNHATGANSTSTVHNSHAAVSVSGTHNVGGLVGYNYASGSRSTSTVENSYATGNVSGSGDYVGGLVGYNYGSGSTSTVAHSYATGNVTGARYVGGLVGHSRIGLSGTSTLHNTYASGNVTGSSYVGGLLGSTGSSTVANSYATGNVTGTGSYVGGLVGHINTGTVQDCYATGEVSGGSYVGGLVGNNFSGGSTVQRSMALSARVSSTGNTSTSSTTIGRVVGSNAGTLSDNYARHDMRLTYGSSNSEYDATASGENSQTQKDGEDTAAAAYGELSFWDATLGWDFSADWQWNATTHLPILQNVGGTQNHTVQP